MANQQTQQQQQQQHHQSGQSGQTSIGKNGIYNGGGNQTPGPQHESNKMGSNNNNSSGSAKGELSYGRMEIIIESGWLWRHDDAVAIQLRHRNRSSSRHFH